jgi:hypothetical protein
VKTVRVLIDGHERRLPRACRAVHVLATALLDGTYRIFRDKDGLLGAQLHPCEFIFPEDGDEFVCIPHASGLGGDNDRRVKMISAAIASDDGDEEAWQRYEEWERNDEA